MARSFSPNRIPSGIRDTDLSPIKLTLAVRLPGAIGGAIGASYDHDVTVRVIHPKFPMTWLETNSLMDLHSREILPAGL